MGNIGPRIGIVDCRMGRLERGGMKLSPENWYYKFDPDGPTGQRLTRKRHLEQPWSAGHPQFSVQTMSAEELRFVAAVIDEARVGVVR